MVQLFIKDDFLENTQSERLFENINPDLNIVYEDENIILCDKKCGMLVHSDDEGEKNTLIEHIKAYLWQKKEYIPENEQSFAPALCNRIDRNTGGIVIAAKNAAALRVINEKIKNNEVKKSYLCVCHGIFDKKHDILNAYLKKDAATNTVKIYDKQIKDSKKIITEYTVLYENDGLSLLKINLVTGRTHQIRAQMAYIGHPLYGDGKYSKNLSDRKNGAKYQALYSYKVNFDFTEPSCLDYLKGKSFCVNTENIWFLSEKKIFGEMPKKKLL